jgi:hypothetical protein
MPHTTREEWLNEAVNHVSLLYAKTKEDGEPVSVPDVRVSVGFGSRMAKTARGWCFESKAAEDGVHHIFITPTLGPRDALQILATLIHELAHAIDDCQSGHSGRFRKLVSQMGLVSPYTSATAGDGLTELLKPILDTLGPYPHSALMMTETKKKQTTRMIKADCKAIVGEADVLDDVPAEVEEEYAGRIGETCGYQVRTTKKWLAVGIPSCPVHGSPLEVEGAKDGEEVKET